MCTILMAIPLPSPLNPIPSKQVEGDENDESDLDNENLKEVDKIPGCSNNNDKDQHEEQQDQQQSTDSDNDPHEEPAQQESADSSTAHTDSENDEEENKDKLTPLATPLPVVVEELNKNEDPIKIPESSEEVSKAKSQKWPRPPTPRSPARSHKATRVKKKSIEEDSSSDENFNSDCTKESYVQMRLRRKTLLKIEKLTDSDSRSRERMRRRALSPPTSSDEENLHIGWVAYPASFSSPRVPKGHRRRKRQITICACAEAVRGIFSSVSKVCRKCRNNKVADSESAQEKLLDQNQTQADNVVGDQ